MFKETVNLWKEGENTYYNGQFQAQYFDAYVHDEDDDARPALLVVPGGGYDHLSPNEAENVAVRFYHLGYQAFVLNYTVDSTKSFPLKHQPLKDISRAVRLLRKNADKYRIYESKVVVCGFSAGGHLAASLCVHYKDVEDPEFADFSNRPDGAILSYPVITSSTHAHKRSFEVLLGPLATMDDLRYYSIEKQVTEDMVPSFIWCTAQDENVPIDNSLVMAKAMREKKVPYALHIYSEGLHGINLGEGQGKYGPIPEVQSWPELADSFLMRHAF